MKKIPFILVLILTGVIHVSAALEADRLRVDGLSEPLAIDSDKPMLSWALFVADGQRNISQAAYQLQAASTVEQFSHPDLWDSGRVESMQPGRCRYAGSPLNSTQRVYWRVRLWEGTGKPGPWSAPAWFETGLLKETDWTGSWITMDPALRGNAAAYLRGTVEVSKPFVSARAYISGLGWNELYVNGKRMGDHVLDPAQTDYDKRCFYVAHDITDAARRSAASRRITVGVILGDGWFNQNRVWGGMSYGTPRLRAQFVFTHPDGTQTTIAADPKWRARTGPIISNNVYAGEDYDARKELGDWSSLGASEDGWVAVSEEPTISTRMAPQTLPPIRCIREIPTKSLHEIKPGIWIYDFGENVSGWCRLKIHAKAGTQIRLRFAERTAPDGTLDTSTGAPQLLGTEQVDTYIAKGDPDGETWQPRFTSHGFKCAELTITSGRLLTPPDKSTLTSIVIHTSFEITGKFTCSDEHLNRIHDMAVRTMLANDLGVPSDCPVRERCGWTGDAHCVIKYELQNADAATFFRKYARDIQTGASVGGKEGTTGWGAALPQVEITVPAGLPHQIAPGKRLCGFAAPDWGCAVVIVPWQLYAATGDLSLLDEFHESMERWADFQLGRRSANGMLENGLGDWCSPIFGGDLGQWIGTREVPITSTGLLIRSLSLLAQIEELLGDTAKAERYQQEERDITAKWLNLFFQENDLPSRSQTALSFALQVENNPAKRAKLFDSLLSKTNGGSTFETGIFGTPLVLQALSEGGQSAIARKLLTKPESPSYRALYDMGLTTLPEHWPDKAGNLSDSLSHPMQGGFDAWLYEDVAGLASRNSGNAPWQFCWNQDSGLTWASAEQMSPLGRISSSWRTENATVTWNISVPPGSQAEVSFPDLGQDGFRNIKEKGQTIEGQSWLLGHEHRTDGLSPREIIRVGSGNYQFSFPHKSQTR